jgi:hypothetical protein
VILQYRPDEHRFPVATLDRHQLFVDVDVLTVPGRGQPS